MASFVFTGDPRAKGSDPAACQNFGLTFTLNGDPVEVADEAIAAKLRTHSHFTETSAEKPRRGRPPKVEEEKVEEPKSDEPEA